MAAEENVKYRRLTELADSETGIITRIFGHGSFRNRITEMGFVRGKQVKMIKNAPMLDPVEYEIMGYHVALRRSEAELIEVIAVKDAAGMNFKSEDALTFGGEGLNRFFHAAANHIDIALVGNPNSGKTSLFNLISGSRERVGNYSGVTVDAKSAVIRHNGYRINMVDLPGTYSVTEYTPEELYVRTHILNDMPDVVINVIDSSNLERNLYLTTQLIDMNVKVVIALNMYDELEKSGARFDYPMLGSMLGIPIVPTVATQGKGIDDLMDKVIAVFEDNEEIVRHIHINYGADIEKSIGLLQNKIWENADIVARYSSRYLAIKLLENDRPTGQILAPAANFADIMETAGVERAKLEKIFGEQPQTAISNAKYGFIAGALSETFTPGNDSLHRRASDIDRFLTHKYWAIPIFLFLMWFMFQTTFTLGQYPMDWMEAGVGWLSDAVGGMMNEGPLKDLLVNGVIGGVGGVIVFLPNILILFFFISLMEDSGYMARAAFIIDRLMHKIGLHGKSFIPLLMGFGCNVPAIMATRTLQSRKDRIITMLITPFMSCSARLPIYVLLISAFFPVRQGLVLFSIYLIGILVGMLSSLLFKKFLFKQEEAPFVMELPPYRIPTTRNTLRHMWDKGVQYLNKMGKVILVASILIWALGHYPARPDLTPAQQQAQSYIGRMGRAIEPVIRPLGFDWQIGISLITGAAAKEIVVSSMAVLNQTEEGDNASLAASLQSKRHTDGPKKGQLVYSPLVAYGLMVFVLLYFPCIAVISAIRREAGWRWAVFTLIYTTGVAWVSAFLIYRIGSLFV